MTNIMDTYILDRMWLGVTYLKTYIFNKEDTNMGSKSLIHYRLNEQHD